MVECFIECFQSLHVSVVRRVGSRLGNWPLALAGRRTSPKGQQSIVRLVRAEEFTGDLGHIHAVLPADDPVLSNVFFDRDDACASDARPLLRCRESPIEMCLEFGIARPRDPAPVALRLLELYGPAKLEQRRGELRGRSEDGRAERRLDVGAEAEVQTDSAARFARLHFHERARYRVGECLRFLERTLGGRVAVAAFATLRMRLTFHGISPSRSRSATRCLP